MDWQADEQRSGSNPMDHQSTAASRRKGSDPDAVAPDTKKEDGRPARRANKRSRAADPNQAGDITNLGGQRATGMSRDSRELPTE